VWGWSWFVIHCRKVRGSTPWGKSCLAAIASQLHRLNKHHRQRPHLSCFDLVLAMRSIESRSFVEMNPLR